MTLTEVVKSKKPFKRLSYNFWIIHNPDFVNPEDGTSPKSKKKNQYPFIDKDTNLSIVFCATAIMASDWILEEKIK